MPVADENAPHLYLNISHPMAAWGAVRGVLVPILTGKPEPGWVSLMIATAVQQDRLARLVNEIIIESIRLARYPDCVSRMTGLFYFATRNEAERATWWGPSFNGSNLTAIELEREDRSSRLDSNWYSCAPRNSSEILEVTDLSWVDRYFAGEPMPTKEPLWEYITQSRIAVLDRDLRQRAAGIVTQASPESVAILEIARASASIGYDLGNIAAFFTHNEGRYRLNWYLDMKVANDPEFLERLSQPGLIVNPLRVASLPEDIFFRVPDFSPYQWEGQLPAGIVDALAHFHLAWTAPDQHDGIA